MKISNIVIALIGITVACLAASIDPSNGGGAVVDFAAGTYTNTFTTPARVVGVSNQGTGTVWVAINAGATSTNLPIPAGGSWTFDMPGFYPIKSVSVLGTNPVSRVYIGASL